MPLTIKLDQNEFPKYQTVEWWIKELQEMPNKGAVVKIATEMRGAAHCFLGIYEGDEKQPTVWIDIGDPNYVEY